MMGKNIGFVSTRFAGTDGVSLEASKWAEVFEKSGYRCFWFGGKLDRDPEKSFLVPEAHFLHSQNQWINERVIGRKGRKPSVTRLIHALRSLLKVQLHHSNIPNGAFCKGLSSITAKESYQWQEISEFLFIQPGKAFI